RDLYDRLELPLATVLADLEERGICIDTGYLRKLSESVGARLADIEKQAYEHAGEQFNLGSPKQLSQVLFDKLGLRAERMKKTKSGGYSTDYEVLDSMRELHPVVPLVIEHRELTKLKGTYIDALPPLVNPRTGRLHTTFKQAVAATGRLSSQEPNLQNIPVRSQLGREIRQAFVAAEGMKLVSADYSQIELRVMAHLSGDPVLVRAFKDGVDVHTQTAAEVFDIGLDEVGSDERRVAKAVNYGLIYGQSAFGLGRALDIPQTKAKHYIERYFERFSTVRKFMDSVVSKARAAGAAETIMGRRRPIPDLRSKNYRLRSAAERVAQNTPMQGTAADIMKLAMLRVDPLLATHGAAMLLTVHDELVIEVPADAAEAVGAEVKEAMESAYQLDVPLVVDVGISTDWAHAH
ncbi:MAG: DNA polymerase I, partial [Deltaproteobacteria bacterium]|nr:DNA polymerase I [Deltaproteobacteria bacterium]